MSIDIADAVIVGVVVLGGLLAMLWGFVRVVLVMAAWVGAAHMTLYVFPLVKPYLRDVISITFVADAIGGIGIFVIALVVFSVIADLIADTIRGTRVSALDRSLGLLVGLLLGAVVVCTGYVGLTVATGTSEPPAWLKSARLLPVVEYGSKLILKLVPEGIRELGGIADSTSPPVIGARSDEKGYRARERRALDQLIRTQQEQ